MLSSISFIGTAVLSGRNFRLKSGALGICNRWNLETKIHIRMESTDANRKTGGGSHSLKPDSKLEQIIHENAADGWEKSWELGVTPWDLGRPTPILRHLHQTGVLPKGRALIPGCGSGYDVAAISCSERFVVGLDISENCIKRANELHSSSPSADHFEFVKADFFTWKPTELFDLIFDYTFFCAIEPHMRLSWAIRIHELLKPDGELITLMFPLSDHNGGPPYKVSVTDYEDVLSQLGFQAEYIDDNDLAIGARKVYENPDSSGHPPNSHSNKVLINKKDGREKLGRWKRSKSRALL